MPKRRRGRTKGLTLHKFGRASLADMRGMKNAIALVRRTAGPGVVVVSALARGTVALLEAAGAVGRKAAGGVEETAEPLANRHRRCLAGVVPPGPVRDELKNEIARSFGELALLSRAPVFPQDLSPATLDSLLARGEELAARIFAAGLTAARRRAVRVSPLDLIVTDGRFGGASPLLPETDRNVRRALAPLLRCGGGPGVVGFLG